jgi:sarcosine oxidase
VTEQPERYLQTDVVVVGVGAMGSAALWRLAERGIPAIGFERFEPGHDRGSSHGETRILRTAYLEGPAYVPLAQRAIGLWGELERVSGVSLMVVNGGLMLGSRDSDVITGTMASVETYGLPYRLLDATQLRTEYPAHRVSEDDVAIFEHEAGFLRPELAVTTAAGRAEDLGATVVRNSVIRRIENRPGGVRVTADGVVCDARHAVVSVGAWLQSVFPDLHLPVRVTRQIATWWPLERPQLFTPDRFPIFIRDIGGSITADSSFYGFPSQDGATIKVAIHREGNVVDPDTIDREVSAEDLAPIRDHINRYLDGVRLEPVRTSVCMYTNTPDHDFLIGSPPGMSNLTILGGFSGHGFKFASVIGDIAADLAARGGTDYPVSWLSPDRFLAPSHA